MAPQHAIAHLILGGVEIATNRAAQGIEECERALALDRNLADAHAHIGLAKYLIGRSTETEVHINEALHLSPAISTPSGGCSMLASPRCSSMPMLTQSLGSVEASRLTEIIRFRILGLAATLALIGSLGEARAAPNYTLRSSSHPCVVLSLPTCCGNWRC
jgi:tetratricopeptide (TPR) repeat protein